jgi:hypothetical protein
VFHRSVVVYVRATDAFTVGVVVDVAEGLEVVDELDVLVDPVNEHAMPLMRQLVGSWRGPVNEAT